MDTKELRRALRECANLSHLAKKVNVSVRTLRRIKNGWTTKVQPSTLEVIERGLK